MDPAQLEADIAALTDAIAAESAGLRSDHVGYDLPRGVSHHDYASVMHDVQHVELYGQKGRTTAQTNQPDDYAEAQTAQQPVADAVHRGGQPDVAFRNEHARQLSEAAEPAWTTSRSQEHVLHVQKTLSDEQGSR